MRSLLSSVDEKEHRGIDIPQRQVRETGIFLCVEVVMQQWPTG